MRRENNFGYKDAKHTLIDIGHMNIDGLLNRYFGGDFSLPTIEMFDEESIHAVYTDIVNTLKMQPDIELGVLQTLSYCFYEVLDNVLTHSKKHCGSVAMRYSPAKARIQIMVVDDGIGIRQSLAENDATGTSRKKKPSPNVCLTRSQTVREWDLAFILRLV